MYDEPSNDYHIPTLLPLCLRHTNTYTSNTPINRKKSNTIAPVSITAILFSAPGPPGRWFGARFGVRARFDTI
ncbi:hypothetical protein GE21DRAFT_1293062 [Neurospora crassa]|nr:hypothetical protein GE21DRAFT_1293062 [Neurospora crassa]